MSKFLSGKVVQGFGEGKRFLSMHEYRQKVRESLGFSPFPGTLNIETDVSKLKEFLSKSKAIHLNGFERNSKRFFGVTLYRAWISSFNAALVFPEKKRHPENIVEIISDINLRKKLKLRNGDEIKIQRWNE